MPGLRGAISPQVFRTVSDGDLSVSKSCRLGASKSFRGLITFSARKSHFDINNESSVANEFRGFFSLFWISIGILTMQVYIRGIESRGRPLDFAFAAMVSQDAIALALSDFALILSTGFCIPIAIALKKRWIRYYWTGLVIQHIFQAFFLFSAIIWTFNRKWPWVQSGFLTLHSLVLIMKMHSYVSANGHFQLLDMQSDILLRDLRRATEPVGGWEEAIRVAAARRRKMGALLITEEFAESPASSFTAGRHFPDAAATPTISMTSNTLRSRLLSAPFAAEGNPPVSIKRGKQMDTQDTQVYIHQPHPLVDHVDHQIVQLAKEYSDLQSELTSSGPNYITWPRNITFRNFALYHFFPTLVYELEYPRTDRIRPFYVFEKILGTFGTMALLYTVIEQFILPNIPTSEQSILRSVLDLALPFMIAYLLLFYIIFECICNAFAELSFFADRQFYEDWWNSTSWDEFSRKWNKPVYVFLLRHVYAPPVFGYGVSKTWAMSLTFLLSACVHELVMIVVTKKLRMYLFVLQIVQIPIILVSRLPILKRNRFLGNLVFWLSLCTGFPLLCVAYVTY